MKKLLSVVLALLLLALVGCNKAPEKAPSDSVAPESTTQKVEPLSYEEFFSELRPYEILSMKIGDNRCVFNRNYMIFPSESVKRGYDGEKYEGEYFNGEYKENSLYIADRTDVYPNGITRISPFCTDYDIYCDDVDNYSKYPYFCTADGVYVVINRTELALLNENGEKIKTVCTAENGVEAFTIRESLLWYLSDGTIYRVYLPDGNVDKIIDGIDMSVFTGFYAPISNFEIQWRETADDEYISKYYNAKTKEKKTKTEKIVNYEDLESINDIPTSKSLCNNTGWWFVPEEAYDKLRSVQYTLPDGIVDYGINNLILNDLFIGQVTDEILKKHDIDVMFSCGGAIKLFVKDSSENIGWISINYDFKPFFKDKDLTDVKGIPSWYKLNEFKRLTDDNNIPTDYNILLADGEFQVYGMEVEHIREESIDGRFLPYRFAFICQGKNEPVYCFMLRSDLYSEEDFKSILYSIRLK